MAEEVRMKFENTGKDARNVTMRVNLLVDENGIEFQAVDFLPKKGDSHAESWACWFFNNYVAQYTMMAEMFFRGFCDNDLIICDAEGLNDGKCEFRIPRPLGRLLWKKLTQCGVIDGEMERNFALKVKKGSKMGAKGFRIIPGNPALNRMKAKTAC